MQTAITDYTEAFQAYEKLSHDETAIKLAKKQAYYKFMRAKDELKAIERELLAHDKVE